MSTNGDAPVHDGEDLARLREKIDELKSVPAEELVSPDITKLDEVSEPAPPDAVGSEEWNVPADRERTEL